jgi:hypothetical protein
MTSKNINRSSWDTLYMLYEFVAENGRNKEHCNACFNHRRCSKFSVLVAGAEMAFQKELDVPRQEKTRGGGAGGVITVQTCEFVPTLVVVGTVMTSS